MEGAVAYSWDGAAMRPLPALAAELAERFAVGEVVTLAPVLGRSSASHRHYFACVREAWLNLPEPLAARFPTEERLRKYALIKAGFCEARQIVCVSKADAQRLAATVSPLDDYAVIAIEHRVVTVCTAKSQSGDVMSKAQFQASKDAVLGVLAEMIGVEPADLVAIPKQSAA
jgi:hypothetical protein